MSHLWILKIAVGIMAIPLLAIGLRGAVTKRPFLVSLRHFVWIMSIPSLLSVVAFGGLIFDSPFNNSPFNSSPFNSSPFNALGFAGIILLIVFLLVFGIMLFVMWKQTDGYSAFGVTDESFQEALRSALKRLNLPFEETIFRLRLTSIGADLQASVLSSMGCAQLMIKQSGHRSTLKSIAVAMNDYFKTEPCKTNMTTNICYIIIGALTIIAALYI
jgi:hypothetical protein